MKTKLLSLASLLAILNANAIEIGPTGSGVEMSGFVDVAFSKSGPLDADATGAQVETNFSYATGPVSAVVGLDFGGGALYSSGAYKDDNASKGFDSYDGNLEEAYITYDFGNGFSATGGKMLTYMGFEAFDPTNMYQFSYAYDVIGTQDIYDAHDYGASIDYGTDAFSIGFWSSLENDAGYELALAYTGIENFTAKAIWSDFSDQGYEKSTFWVSYQLDKLLLAAEVAENDQQAAGDDGGNLDVDGMLIMANYAVSDAIGLTLRYSEIEYTAWNNPSSVSFDGSKFTISPSYVFTDNFSGLVEYSSYSKDSGSLPEPDELLGVEFIYTF